MIHCIFLIFYDVKNGKNVISFLSKDFPSEYQEIVTERGKYLTINLCISKLIFAVWDSSLLNHYLVEMDYIV